jgi:hypothetical protein
MSAVVEAPVRELRVSVYVVPTDYPESDGALAWDTTTLVLVEAVSGDTRGLGFTYADRARALLIEETLAPVVVEKDAMSVPACWRAMVGAVRNLGRPGVSSMAIAAVDGALWDLKARLLGTGPRSRHANSDLPGELGVATCHECVHLLVPGLDEAAAVVVPVEGAHEALMPSPG